MVSVRVYSASVVALTTLTIDLTFMSLTKQLISPHSPDIYVTNAALILLGLFGKKPLVATLKGITNDNIDISVRGLQTTT